MYRRHGQKLEFVFLACDLAVTSAAWFAAYALRYAWLPAPHGVPDVEHVAAGWPMTLIMAIVAYRQCGLYEVHRLRELPRELSVIFQASGLVFLMSIAAVFYRHDLYESRVALAIFFGLNVACLSLARRALWSALKYCRSRGLNHGRAVIIGGGRTGRRVAETIHNNDWTGLEAVGFVDRATGAEHAFLPRLGDVDDLAQVVLRHDVDHVFVALPLSRYGELPRVMHALEKLLVEVQFVPDVPDLACVHLKSLEIDNVPFLSLREDPHVGWSSAAKRAMDVALGSAAIVLTAPVMLLLCVLVKVTSPGPMLYRQERFGKAGRRFSMLKFRSMRVDAEAATGPVWASRHDARCTPVGRFMRRWSLDELPQLFNVLAGDMSLVGPRPERGVLVARFQESLPNYHQRHQVKAGITGWAQVNGWRGDTSLRRRLACDLYYVAHWSLAFDLKILWLTLWRGFRHRNAY